MFGLAPSKFKPGPWQFCEADVYVPVSGLTTSTWVGPAVFVAGDRGDGTGTRVDNFWAILVERAGGGSSNYRLYRRSSGNYDYGGGTWEVTGLADAAERPVRLRIEALDTGSAVYVRWWINGVEQLPRIDTSSARIISVSSSTGTGHAFPGLSWGSGNAVESASRQVIRFRGGNMPERKKLIEPYPANEDLPDLVKFDKPWDKQP